MNESLTHKETDEVGIRMLKRMETEQVMLSLASKARALTFTSERVKDMSHEQLRRSVLSLNEVLQHYETRLASATTLNVTILKKLMER